MELEPSRGFLPTSPVGTGEGSEGGVDERIKSSLRLQYEAQVQVIRQQIGSLEKVRSDLGLSQRKMAQLLLVDPSAWTRWNRPGEEAPPHVWRALQWYLTVREKIPGLTPQYFLGADTRLIAEKSERKLELERRARENHIAALEGRLAELEKQAARTRKLLKAGLAAIVFLVFSAFLAGRARAEGATTSPPAVEAPAAEASAATEDVEAPQDRYAIPILYYTPETSLAGGLLLIQNLGEPREGRTSHVTAVAAVTVLGQSSISLIPKYYLKDEGELSGHLSWRFFPSRYFGRGVDGALEGKGEPYTERAVNAGFSHAARLRDDLSVRWGLGYDRHRIVDVETGGLMTGETAFFGEDLEVPSLKLGLELDSRDYPQSPRKGRFHRAQVTPMRPADKTNGRELPALTKYEIDLRRYREWNDRVTWASQLYLAEIAGGDEIPFQLMTGIGGANQLRGFPRGRYLDRALAMAQTEARVPFRRKFAWTVGASWGRLASTASEWAHARDLWAGSVGFHYVLDPRNRTKLRLDVGFADRAGAYFILGEAF